VPWLHCQKNCWPTVLGSVAIQLYAGECTPSVDRALRDVRDIWARKTAVGHFGTKTLISTLILTLNPTQP